MASPVRDERVLTPFSRSLHPRRGSLLEEGQYQNAKPSEEGNVSKHAAPMAVAMALFSATGLMAQEKSSTGAVYEAQESAGTVTLELQPRWADGVMLLEVSANTHSVDLASLDLAGDVRLVVDEVEYAPVEAGSLSGHHARATLRFEVPNRPASFRLVIQDVPDFPLRLLSWPAGG